MPFDSDLRKGSMPLLVLHLLATREMYGYEIIEEARRRSEDLFEFKEGTLYPVLHDMEHHGYLRATWRVGPNGRERKYYGLTAKGKRFAEESRRQWAAFAQAVNAVLAVG